MNRLPLTLAVLGLLLSAPAAATTDMPGPFDGRVVGLGGTGAAWLKNPAAIYVNPANLDGIGTLSLSLDFSPFVPSASAPLNGPGTSVDSATTFSPLFFAGGAYRVHERVVVGLAAYPTAGVGARFEEVPALGGGDLESSIFVLETQLPVSVRLAEGLSLAVGWRVTYARQSNTSYAPVPGAPAPMQVTQDFSGVDLLGFEAGLAWQPLPMLRLGLSYRSKVTVDLEGTTTMGGLDLDSSTQFATPHSARLGAALSLLDDKLMLALDFKFLFFKESNPKMVVTTETPFGPQETEVRFNWKNAGSGHLGVEYRVLPMLALRLGYSLTASATPEENATPFAMPPGFIHTPSAGVGLSFERFDVDLGASYSIASSDVEGDPVRGVMPGTYKNNSLLVSLSGTFRY